MPDAKAGQAVKGGFKRPLLRTALAVATTAMVAAPTQALADTFLKLDGIKGESTDAKHKDEIEILSFSQSFINSIDLRSGGAAGVGKVQCGPVTVMKSIDKSSPMLLQAVATGQHIPTGVLSFQGNTRTSPVYYTITLNQVFVTELSQTDSADPSRIFEKLVLQAAVYEFKYTPLTAKGTLGTPVSFKWDCTSNKGA